MMKKALLLTAIFTLCSFSVKAAEMKPYASLKAVYSWEEAKLVDDIFGAASETFKTPGFNLAFGTGFQGFRDQDTVRVEIEYGYRDLKSKLDPSGGIMGKDKVGLQTYMVNGYYDISTGTIVTPYVGIGLGLADTKIKYQDDEDIFSTSNTEFAWNLNAGIGIKVSKDIAIDIGYRYLQIKDYKIDFGLPQDVKSKANEVSVGISYEF